MKIDAPKCCGGLDCPKDRSPESCGWIGTCLDRLRGRFKKLQKKKNHRPHPIEMRSDLEIRAEMKRQDDDVKREGHWQG